jgi:hypothetical protein
MSIVDSEFCQNPLFIPALPNMGRIFELLVAESGKCLTGVFSIALKFGLERGCSVSGSRIGDGDIQNSLGKSHVKTAVHFVTKR